MPFTTERPLTIAVTDRDLQLLRGLFEARVMTLAHAAAFHFGGRIEAATKRIQKLKRAGVIAERPRRVYEPSILFLTRRAFALLGENGILTDYPKIGWAMLEKRARVSALTLRHELQVLDVRAAFYRAVASASERYTLETFNTWPLLNQFRAAPGIGRRDVIVRPDGFIRTIEHLPHGETAETSLFLELDRSTETQAILAAKAACYGDFYRRGGMAARHGRPRSEYQLFPFRLLIVCRNVERRNNAAARMLRNQPPVLTQAWLTTFDEVCANPLGPIWVRPREYRAALAGTAFDLHERAGDMPYVRCVERDALVESSVRKLCVLGDGDPPAVSVAAEEACTIKPVS